jgi:GT2 family glycosyltransferase
MFEVSVVVVTYNSEKYISACLDSLASQTYREFETIVVDNGSKDATVHLIRKKIPAVILMLNTENFGACRARNQGIEKATGKWVLTLDCDVALDPDFLMVLADSAGRADDRTGVFQPKVFNRDGTVIYSFGIILSSWMRFFDRGKGQSDFRQFDNDRVIFGACTAAALFRREALASIKEDTGFFDERFFFLVEDVDAAWRMGQKGWKAQFVPSAVCYHSGNSSAMNRQKRQYLCWRNRRLFMAKHRLNKPWAVVFYDLPRLIWLLLTNGFVRRQLTGTKTL